MAFTQGSPLPDITETTTKTQAAPEYYTQYLTGLSQAGTGALYTGAKDATGQPVMKTGAELVAGLDPLQQKAYAGIPTAAEAYKPGLTAAGQTATAVAAGLTPERIQSLMNPYTAGVVNEMARLQQENLQRNLLPTMKAGFVGSGGLGSQRYAGALGQMGSDLQRNLLGAQTQALQKGYSDATQAALQEMDARAKAAALQQGIAKSEQELGLAGMGALQQAGTTQQAYEQAKIDAPLKIATQVGNLMAGKQIPITDTTRFVGPKAGAYGASDLATILGIASTLGAMRPGSPGASGLSFLANKIFSPSQDGSTQITYNPISGIDFSQPMTEEDYNLYT